LKLILTSPVVGVSLFPRSKYQISVALKEPDWLRAFVREWAEPPNVKVIELTLAVKVSHPVPTTSSRSVPEGTEKLGMERLVL
jgi:hypothetical protein